MYAAEGGNEDVVDVLLQLGADVNHALMMDLQL